MEYVHYNKIVLFFVVTLIHYTFFSASTSAYQVPPNKPVLPETICKFTPYPNSCRSLLPKRAANVYDYARFSVMKSLAQTLQFQRLVWWHLLRRGASLPPPAVAALEDCRVLAALNADFLMTSFAAINATSAGLPAWQADDVQTLLSAVMTNQQTCYDGLHEASAGDDDNSYGLLAGPIANGTRLYSVSLALFIRGWVPTTTARNFTTTHHRRLHERFPVKRSQLSRREMLDVGRVAVRGVVTVSQDGTGNFSTIGEAVAAAPNNTAAADGYFVIKVKAGVYEEYVSIDKKKKYLMIIGDGINQTVITGNRSVVDGWTTFKSATFAVSGLGFVAVNITFRNTAGAAKHQAVAVRNSADLSTFFQCSFEGYQDTLYTHSLRQFYRECDVYGTVDFIFGNAAVVFQNCNLRPRLPMSGQFNAITAQGRTDPNQNTGTSVHNCTIRAAPDLASANATAARTYLGRPWKEYSRTVFMQSYIDASVDPVGWREWNGDFALSTLYYAEHNNTGPGSATARRVTWPGYRVIGASDAANFTASSFLMADNWVPRTGVAYTSGLM